MEVRREFWVSDPPEEAVRKLRVSLQRIGEITKIVPGIQIEGHVAFGVQGANLVVMWGEEIEVDPLEKAGVAATTRQSIKMRGTRFTVFATSENSEPAARSAAERLEDAYLHYADTAYKADRLGLMPATIIGALVVILLLGVMAWRIPALRRLLPNVHPHIVPVTAPLPSATPDLGTGPDPKDPESTTK